MVLSKWFKKKNPNSGSHDLGLLSLYIFEVNVFIFQFLNDEIHNCVKKIYLAISSFKDLKGLRHILLLRAFYCLGTLCIVTFCSKEQFPSNWLVTVCFLTHFATQELNTLCSPTHFAKSQFTPQHTLVINTLCHSEPFTPHYTLLLNTLCLPALFASWSTLLPNTFCSMNRNGNNPIYSVG